MRMSIFLIILSSLCLSSFNAFAFDCSPLNPSGKITNAIDTKIEGAATALFKLGSIDGNLSGKVKEEITNVFNYHPDANETTVKNRLIYLFCEMLGNAKEVSDSEKFEKLSEFSDKILKTNIKVKDKNQQAFPSETLKIYKNEREENFGKNSRFIKRDCGSIVDRRTGLEWLVGPNFNINWHEAVVWVDKLSICGSGWRIPNIHEAKTLYNKKQYAGIGYFKDGKFYPARISRIFNDIGNGSWIWREGKVINGKAPAYNLYEHIPVQLNEYNNKYTTRVFAVKAIILP